MKKFFLQILFFLTMVFSFSTIWASDAYIDSLKTGLTAKDYGKNFKIYKAIAMYEMEQDSLVNLEYIKKTISVSKYLSKEVQAKCLYDFAYKFRKKESYGYAEEFFLQSIKISEKSENLFLKGKTLNQLGNIERYKANYSQSQDYYIEALKIFEKLGNNSYKITVYAGISLAYKELEDYDSALKNLFEAKKILDNYKNDKILCSILSSIGNVYKRLDNFDEAKKYFAESLLIAQKISYSRGVIINKLNYALILIEEKKYNEAIEDLLLFKNLAGSETLLTSRDKIKIDNYLCESYNAIGEYAKAKKYGLIAKEKAEQVGYLNSLKIIYENLSKLYENTKQYKNSIFYLRKSIDIHKKVVNETIIENTKELEVKYRSAKQQQKIIVLQKENQIKNQRLITVIVLALLMLIIIILGSIIVRVKSLTTKKLEKEIAERKKTEVRLAENEKLLRLLIDSIPIHIFLKNEELKFVMVNKTMTDYYRLSDEEFINHDLFDIGEKFEFLDNAFRENASQDVLAFENKTGQDLITEVENPYSSSKQWFFTQTKYIELGNKGHLLGIAQDITHLKLAQENLEDINSNLEIAVVKRTKELQKVNIALKEEIAERINISRRLSRSELQYKTLLHNIPQSIFYKDLDLNYILCNQSFANDVGEKIENIIGKNDFSFFDFSIAERFLENDKIVLENREIEESEEKYIKNKSERIVHTVKAPIRDENGEIIGLLGIFWDVTDQRRAEQQVLYSERISGIGELAGGVAHEIKNPLSNISSAIQLLEEDLGDNKQFGHLIDIIHESVADASQTIFKLIKFASPQKLELKDGDIYKVLEHTCSLLKSNIVKSKIKLELKKIGEFPVIQMDEVHMQSLFMNTILNAIQSMPNGGKIMIIAEADKTKIAIKIIDTGCGIPKNQLSQIFDPFYTTKPKGSGLGMGLIFSVMKFHNGTINIESEVDVGTKITLTLPLQIHNIKRIK